MEPECAGGVDKPDFEKWSEMASLIRHEKRTRRNNATERSAREGLQTWKEGEGLAARTQGQRDRGAQE